MEISVLGACLSWKVSSSGGPFQSQTYCIPLLYAIQEIVVKRKKDYSKDQNKVKKLVQSGLDRET